MRSKKSTAKKSSEDQFMAASIGDVEWLRQSLKESGSAGDFDRNGLAAVHLAAIHGRLDCLKLLIEQHKCDVNFPSSTGWRPVHLCISGQTGKRSMKCLLYLLDKGADHSCLNDDMVTPVHQAASEGHLAALELLVSIGAKLDQADTRGFKPIDMAKMWGHKKCARLLATETWRLQKDQLAKKLQMEKRVTMKQLLRQFERQEQLEEEEQYRGNEAFDDWVEQVEAGKAKRRAGRPNSKESKEAESAKEAKKETAKESPAARLRQPLEEEEEEEEEQPQSDSGRSGGRRRQQQDGDSPLRHSRPWNSSTHVGDCFHAYQPSLEDAYPRDEFTMMPHPRNSHPLRLNARSQHPAAAAANEEDRRLLRDIGRRRAGRTGSSGDSDASAASDDEAAMEERKEQEQKPFREQLFKCKSVLDVERRRRVEEAAAKYRGEAALHLISDPTSFLFRQALGPAESGVGGDEEASSRSSSGLVTPQLRA